MSSSRPTDDDDLRDRMYAANLRHGVQYSREQKRAYGIALPGRELSAKEIARLSGVGVGTVYRWTRELRDQDKEERDSEIQRLRDDGLTQQEIADELGMGRSTIAEIVGDSQMRKSDEQPESKAEPEIEAEEAETIEVDEGETEEEPDERLGLQTKRLVQKQNRVRRRLKQSQPNRPRMSSQIHYLSRMQMKHQLMKKHLHRNRNQLR